MDIITTPHPTLEQFIEQMRLLCIANKHTVQIQHNREQAIASFYVKGSLVDKRTLFLLPPHPSKHNTQHNTHN